MFVFDFEEKPLDLAGAAHLKKPLSAFDASIEINGFEKKMWSFFEKGEGPNMMRWPDAKKAKAGENPFALIRDQLNQLPGTERMQNVKLDPEYLNESVTATKDATRYTRHY